MTEREKKLEQMRAYYDEMNAQRYKSVPAGPADTENERNIARGAHGRTCECGECR